MQQKLVRPSHAKQNYVLTILQESMEQMLVDILKRTSNPVRRSTLERIEENIQDHISEIDIDGTLSQELGRIRTTNSSHVALSIKTAKFVSQTCAYGVKSETRYIIRLSVFEITFAIRAGEGLPQEYRERASRHTSATQ